MRSRLLLLPAAVLTALVLAGPASAETSVAIKVGPAPGTPAKYDKVFVTKFGSPKAKKVLVLIPGTNGGAGNFTLVARQIVKRLPSFQVWAMDRREQALEDTSRMEQAFKGAITPQQALDYYLGWIANPAISPHYAPLQGKDYAFMKNWGMRVNLDDTRRVVLAARKGGRTVVLGGHSLGASFAAAYAAWNFNGRPGYKDIAGIVAIDGGLLGTFNGMTTAAQAKSALAKLDVTKSNPDGPWLNLLNIPGFSWTTGPFAEVGALAAMKDPNAPSILQGFPLLPGILKPSYQVTNEGALGYSFDATTSPPVLSLIQVRAGQQAAGPEPRGWQNGEVTPIQNVAAGFAQGRVNGVDWYYPARLNVDTNAASPMANTPAAKTLGLSFPFLKDVNIPYYAFQTSLTAARNGVINGAKNFARKSRVPKGGLVVVNAGTTTSHLDPLLAAPATNQFLKTVVPFLRDKVKG